LKDAGFKHVDIVDSKADLNAYSLLDSPGCCGTVSTESTGCCGSVSKDTSQEAFKSLFKCVNVNDYAASVKIFAVKA
jgi:arsenite methyltransferase